MSRQHQVRPTWPLYLAVLLTAGAVAAGFAWSFLGESLAALGIPDPGPVTTAGLPFLRASAWVLAALALGSFMVSAFYLDPAHDPAQDPVQDPQTARNKQRTQTLTVDAHIAARTGAYAALGFAVIALVMVPMVLSDVSGQPFTQAVQFFSMALDRVAAAKAWLASAVIAVLVGVAALVARSWRAQPLLAVGAFAMVLPLGLEGHSAAGGDHDYGTNSLLWHLLFMMIWVGGLVGLIAHARRLGPQLGTAVRRYSALALWAVVVMSISGVINAAIRVRLGDLFTSDYGRMIVLKAVLVLVLAALGFAHRRVTLPRLDAGDWAAFVRVGTVEVLVMAVIVGVSVSLGRTPPPPPRVTELTQMQVQMGYTLEQAPTLWNVWTIWRFDIMFSLFALIISAFYLRGLLKLRSQSKPWPVARSFWFFLGTATLALTMSSGVGLYMPAMFSMHMVAHMILSMVVPVFLVLGAPLTLVLEAAEPNSVWRRWIQALLDSRILRVMMHPAFNTIQFITIFYLLYVTPWYTLMVSEHAGHLIMNWVFLASGYLYYWEMIGADPKPRDNSVIKRLAWLVFSMPFHLYFGVYLMQLQQVLAEDFYLSLDLPWDIDLKRDQGIGGGIAWASGSFPLVVVFGTLFLQWLREDRKTEREYEQAAEANDDAELAAYNEMLARMQRKP
ncbi:bifunctional copper resistance protein CopD/cytochrome c oxidase assembly protein [Corynebacterium kozikiae]|uniref:bifunctional copper resistance protein CopD/cytochrome c oxidase assembly protein n=1 Tax=Corynebacterium kozikiae TaxID=2968469 RepID=UPI00211C2314|nr:bifunctional copper resistance protein CopD/cytochrome c oxidase assembly protein [Corynebacterium sp. 76QC2CO]MCQ9343252.1 bifunctional copper resistance protein CopD/cytochrome c oxidase assembly protein [Corynebacterium sp. 76QC2CO]